MDDQQVKTTWSIMKHALITLSFLIGVIGNIAALWILHKSSKNRNRKHVFLLRCLITNDIVAQVGMMVTLTLKEYKLVYEYITCLLFVLLRGFGLGSGCVAFVMALERWLALTRPFLYHQLVSYRTLKRFLFCLWFAAILLTYMPLFGFGLYWNGKGCERYRNATKQADVIYAFLFFTFGAMLCTCIALCNITVIFKLLKITSQKRILVRRVSRSVINNRGTSCTIYQTPEEVAFAKMMAVICVIFIVCWAPQVVSVPLAQFMPHYKEVQIFLVVPDLLLGIYFTLDPFVYVLQKYIDLGSFIFPCCFSRPSSPITQATSTTTGTPTSVLLHPPSFNVPVNMNKSLDTNFT